METKQNDKTIQTKAEILIMEENLRQKLISDAGRFHNKNLFVLWWLCVALFGTYTFYSIPKNNHGISSIFPLFLMLIFISGAYTLQEVSRTHKRIDAIFKLIEKKQNNKNI